MQAFKIAHFEKDRPGRRFPAYRSLDESESRRLKASVARKAGVSAEMDSLSLVKHLDSLAEPIDGVNAEDAGFDLRSLFRALSIQPPPEVFLNWFRLDQVDQLHWDDLAANFDDIWYPSSDDLDIIDPALSWIVSINHEGAVKILRLGK